MDVSQIKVGSINLIEEEPKIKDIEVSEAQTFFMLECERFEGETVLYVSLLRDHQLL